MKECTEWEKHNKQGKLGGILSCTLVFSFLLALTLGPRPSCNLVASALVLVRCRLELWP